MIPSNAYLEVNLKNIIFNYKYLSSFNKKNLTGATIKANAYGLGDKKIIETLYKIGCRHFFLATLEEAINLRKNFKYGKLYILNGIDKQNFNRIAKEKNIIPIINSIENLNDFLQYKKRINVGIHLDTGINRLGIKINDINKIKLKKNIKIKIILSHLASADEKNNPFNIEQNKYFKQTKSIIPNNSLKSLANSAGISLGKDFHHDLTRPGIAIYGGHNNTTLNKKIKPVVKLKAKVIQLKNIKKNEYVGYNQTFKSKKNMKIAILSIGYADGILRRLSNKGYVYYKKNKFKIIGRISMDSITIDISKNPQLIKNGIFVDLINYENDIEKFAKICNTISNEILTLISQRVIRIYIN
tara:strand:+ start:616 stop:1683 length:1068 start_codon:yes stop_codon:yes gene_type:complete